jgi:hypothetical protein
MRPLKALAAEEAAGPGRDEGVVCRRRAARVLVAGVSVGGGEKGGRRGRGRVRQAPTAPVAVGGEAVMEAGLSTGRVSAEGGRWPPDPAATGDRGGGRRQGRAREGGPSVTFLFFFFVAEVMGRSNPGRRRRLYVR